MNKNKWNHKRHLQFMEIVELMGTLSPEALKAFSAELKYRATLLGGRCTLNDVLAYTSNPLLLNRLV